VTGPLAAIDQWPVDHVAAAIVPDGGLPVRRGAVDHVFRLASLSKILTTWAVLIAVEEGSIALDAPVGQPGCTLRHLLCHAGGYAFDGEQPIARPESRRIYSNTGIELAAGAVADRTGLPFGTYLAESVFEPLGMVTAELRGSAAHGIEATLDDLIRFVVEVTEPTLLSGATVADARSVQFADLAGVVPGVGSFRPCPWGLGGELHGTKHPHWMGVSNSPTTFGHFGGSGTMMWIDPAAGTSLIALTDRQFDDWSADALRLWPALSDAVVADAHARPAG
jgi:CubicO group peptidase (beta-lactamase class C family)